jgi:hypothetical protein
VEHTGDRANVPLVSIVLVLILVAALGAGYYVFRQSGKSSSSSERALPSSRAANLAAPKLAPSGAKKENWLVGVGGEVEGKTFLIGERMLTIGRTPNNAIQITDAAASRQHCQVKPVDGGLQIVDMSSTNATFINDQPSKMGRLAEGDELRIGEARFVFRRHVDADRDDRLAGKVAGPAVHKSTEEARQSPELLELVQKTVEEMDGDLDRAASKLGVPQDVVRRILEERAQL